MQFAAGPSQRRRTTKLHGEWQLNSPKLGWSKQRRASGARSVLGFPNPIDIKARRDRFFNSLVKRASPPWETRMCDLAHEPLGGRLVWAPWGFCLTRMRLQSVGRLSAPSSVARHSASGGRDHNRGASDAAAPRGISALSVQRDISRRLPAGRWYPAEVLNSAVQLPTTKLPTALAFP